MATLTPPEFQKLFNAKNDVLSHLIYDLKQVLPEFSTNPPAERGGLFFQSNLIASKLIVPTIEIMSDSTEENIDRLILNSLWLYVLDFGFKDTISFIESRTQWLDVTTEYTVEDLNRLILENSAERIQLELGNTTCISMKNIMELINAFVYVIAVVLQEDDNVKS